MYLARPQGRNRHEIFKKPAHQQKGKKDSKKKGQSSIEDFYHHASMGACACDLRSGRVAVETCSPQSANTVISDTLKNTTKPTKETHGGFR